MPSTYARPTPRKGHRKIGRAQKRFAAYVRGVYPGVDQRVVDAVVSAFWVYCADEWDGPATWWHEDHLYEQFVEAFDVLKKRIEDEATREA